TDDGCARVHRVGSGVEYEAVAGSHKRVVVEGVAPRRGTCRILVELISDGAGAVAHHSGLHVRGGPSVETNLVRRVLGALHAYAAIGIDLAWLSGRICEG